MADQENRVNKEDMGDEGIPTASYGDAALGPGVKIGRYKLLRMLGEGGYGIVYLAEQLRPVSRRVALKLIKPGMDSKQVIARFEAERQALALLDHPHIAHVFKAGTTDAGHPYFAMEYVQGVPITEHCDRYKLTIEERLKLFMTVCEAVQYAHQKAIIHRDIKPSNILVTYEGEQAIPMIIDFGVAKALNRTLTDTTLVTEQAQMIGTPEYMSPEQAEMTGQDIDTRTDVYSLGALLYELLTGTLPFDPQTLRGSGVEGMRRMIREQDPKTPSVRLSTIGKDKSQSLAQQRRTDTHTLNRHLQGELDWITLKAMDKDRTRRYQTAYALAEDIQRYLNQEPVLAGPPSATYRLRKLIKRNRGLFVSAATITIIVILAAIVSTVLAITATKAQKDAENAKQAETEHRQKAEEARGKAEQAQKELADKAQQQETNLYFNYIKLADQELKANRQEHALGYLNECKEHLRNWEWRYLHRKAHRETTPPIEFESNIMSFDISPDGSKLAVYCDNGKLVFHELDTEESLPIQVRKDTGHLDSEYVLIGWTWVAFSPDGEHVAVIGDNHEVNVISVDSREIEQTLKGHTDIVTDIVWSTDGSLLATVSLDNTVRFWEPRDGKQLAELNPISPPTGLTFTRDGKSIIFYYVSQSEHAEKLDIDDVLNGGKERGVIIKYPKGGHVFWIAASPHTQQMAAAMWDSRIILSDNGFQNIELLEGHSDIVYRVAFTGKGTRLASMSCDLSIRLWDTETLREIIVIDEADPFPHHMVFSKDGHRLFVSDTDRSNIVKVYDATPLEKKEESRYRVLRGHSNIVINVEYSPDGERIISSSIDGTIRLWNASNRQEESRIKQNNTFQARLSPNGEWIMTTDIIKNHRAVKVLNANPPHSQYYFDEFERETWGIAFSHDNQYLIVGGLEGIIYVYDLKAKILIGELGRFEEPLHYISSLTASPDGRHLAVAGFDGDVTLWDWDPVHLSGQQRPRVVYEGGLGFFYVDFSPNSPSSKYLAVGGRNGEIRILDVETGDTYRHIQEAHGDKVNCVSFSPDGKYLASCSSDKTVRIWEVQTGKLVDILLGHTRQVFSVAFSPDGKHIVSGGIDQDVRIWTLDLE
jgi:eukaryotic-like serine/threonine-protein kinase